MQPVLLAPLLVLPNGCWYFTDSREIGQPIRAETLAQIVVGQTTRSDAFRLLGPPHSIFSGQVEFREIAAAAYVLYAGKRHLTSLDEDHYAMVWRVERSEGSTITKHVIAVARSHDRTEIRTSELLLVLDKRTHVVTDVAVPQDALASPRPAPSPAVSAPTLGGRPAASAP